MQSTEEISEEVYEMLRAAVNMAREYQVQTVKALRERLAAKWPNRSADIEAALDYWSSSLKRRYPQGVPQG